uniref:Uncharacterized protein n=1 Tax=Arundo donax TaxID=35708 RepID=A0A0A9CKA6_ARUDO
MRNNVKEITKHLLIHIDIFFVNQQYRMRETGCVGPLLFIKGGGEYELLHPFQNI